MCTSVKELFEKPHRVFFALGAVLALASVCAFLLERGSLASSGMPAINFHTATLFLLVFPSFIYGFLFTVFPRFLFSADIAKSFYTTITSILALAFLLFTAALFVNASMASIAFLLTAITHGVVFWKLFGIYKNSRLAQKIDMSWMTIALGSIVCGSVLLGIGYISSVEWIYRLGFGASLYTGLFLLVMAVAQRMIPFFTESAVAGYEIRKTALFLPRLGGTLLFCAVSYALEVKLLSSIAGLAVFIVLANELRVWKLPLFRANFMLSSMYAALIWGTVSFLAMAANDASQWFFDLVILEKGGVHLLGIGFLLTILISFGSRVALGHSNRPIAADIWIKTIFYSAQVVLLLRTAAEVFYKSEVYGSLIELSGILWCAIFVVFIIRFWNSLTGK